MGGVNPLAALGAVGSGYVEGLNKQRQLAIEEEYKKGLVDQAKLHAKLFEAQAEQAQREGRLLEWAITNSGKGQRMPAPGPGPQGMAPVQPSSPEGMGYPGGPRPMMPQGQPQAQIGPSNYDPLIQKYAQQYGVDPNLVRSVIQRESSFNPQATSPKQAMGLMQLIPGTAQSMGVTNPYDPEQNIMGGTKYLAQLIQQFGGDIPKAVAAYNAGPGRVRAAGGIPPIPETQAFVKNVMGTYQSLPQMVAQGQMQTRMGQVTTDQAGAQGGAYPGMQEPLITPDKFLAGYLEKKFGVKQDEVTVKTRPDGGYDFFHKRTGQYLGTQGPTVAQGEYGTRINPQGQEETYVRPRFPQIGTPPMITKPLKPESTEIQAPTGTKGKIFYNPYAPPQFLPTEPEGIKTAEAGKLNYGMQALNRIDEIQAMVFPKGEYNYELILKAGAPGAKQVGGLYEGRTLFSKMYQALSAALRIETGAQAPEHEIKEKVYEYLPTPLDTAESAKEKLKDFSEYINGFVNLADPTGKLREMRGRGQAQKPSLDLEKPKETPKKIRTWTGPGKFSTE